MLCVIADDFVQRLTSRRTRKRIAHVFSRSHYSHINNTNNIIVCSVNAARYVFRVVTVKQKTKKKGRKKPAREMHARPGPRGRDDGVTHLWPPPRSSAGPSPLRLRPTFADVCACSREIRKRKQKNTISSFASFFLVFWLCPSRVSQ